MKMNQINKNIITNSICILILITVILNKVLHAQQVPAPADESGSAILDDLVNQIIEKNRNVFESEASRAPRQAVSSVGDKSLSSLVAPSTGDELVPDYQASQEMDGDDRHIQYDIVAHDSSTNTPDANYPRLSNYKLMSLPNELPVSPSEDSPNVLHPVVPVQESSQQVTTFKAPEQNNSSLPRAAENGQPIELSTATASQVPNVNGSLVRSLQAARSLQNGSKTPPHTRPPYATHDQFQLSNSLLSDQQLNIPLNESGSRISENSTIPELHRLAPVNQLVELNPIPASSVPTSSSPSTTQDLDRFYFSKDHLMASINGAQPSRGHNDRYASLNNQQQHNEIADSSIGFLSVAEPQSVIARQPNDQHYKASFINVTAPMVPPLSASEAMESALGGGQAAKSLLAQASGFARPPQLLESSTRPAHVQAQSSGQQSPLYLQQNRHQMFGQYHMFNQGDSLYSAPANQFSPRPSLQSSSDSGTQVLSSSATIQSEGGIGNFSNQATTDRERMRLESHFNLVGRRPAYATNNNHLGVRENLTQQASGFRSPIQSDSLIGNWPSTGLPSSYLSSAASMLAASAATASAAANNLVETTPTSNFNSTYLQQTRAPATSAPSTNSPMNTVMSTTTNGFITGVGQIAGSVVSSSGGSSTQSGTGSTSMMNEGPNRRVFNLTRVEHISAECSNDLIRTVIVFNGTFKGIIYSSGYVRDPNCMYINGTGKTRYDFSIRLNQCGTLGRQEVHQPAGPNEVSRQDKVMWNTLSIQYNPIIEQEWDEHFRVSCEYGSDFWKTVSFSPFNVETNTGSPVVFTVDPPQCQMEILRGHGMVGPRQDADSGAVTVGDPLTLLIHMKSEKAGYDILVKNCIAHNGGNQKMQLIDSNGCVVNERFISPFRGTYNDNDLKHVTLYSYLKAFRFTGSPVLYLECEIHMCQSKCPPQMCYWRRLSKRSTNETVMIGNDDSPIDDQENFYLQEPEIEPEFQASDDLKMESQRELEKNTKPKGRTARQLVSTTTTGAPKLSSMQPGQMSDKISLFQALKVLEPPREPNAAPYSLHPSYAYSTNSTLSSSDSPLLQANSSKEPILMCYRQAQVLAILLTTCSMLIVALSVALGCCWRVVSSRRLMNRCSANSARELVANRQSLCSTISSISGSSASSPSAKQLSHSPYAMTGSLISIASDDSSHLIHKHHHQQQHFQNQHLQHHHLSQQQQQQHRANVLTSSYQKALDSMKDESLRINQPSKSGYCLSPPPAPQCYPTSIAGRQERCS